MSNLRLINETTISASASTIQIPNVFSADFDIYKITFNNINTNTHLYNIVRMLNASGSSVSSNYEWALLDIKANTSFGESRFSGNGTYWREVWGMSTTTVGTGHTVGYIFNPFSSSSYTFCMAQHQSINTNARGVKGIGVLKDTSSMSGFELTNPPNTFDGGIIRTYGLRVDS